MTKGNWERRAERASLEREAARERKALKNKKFPSIESIVKGLLERKYSSRDLSSALSSVTIKAWVEDMLPSTPICRNWLRLGDCPTKRCRYSHEISLFGIQNIIIGEKNQNSQNEEEKCEPAIEMILLQDVLPERYSFIRFISVDDYCVYDWAFPHVWTEWSTARLEEIASRKALKSVPESDDAVIESLEEPVLTTTQQSHLTQLSQSYLSAIFEFCSLSEICSLELCSHSLRTAIRRDSSLRERKKEYIDSLSKTIQKKKKDEKKKKSKSSYLKKTDKKDGFARGGNC